MDVTIVSTTRKQAFVLILSLLKLIFVGAFVELEMSDDDLLFLCLPEQSKSIIVELMSHNAAVEDEAEDYEGV